MAIGIEALGEGRVTIEDEVWYRNMVIGDVAVFYGMSGKLPQITADYLAAGKTVVFIDLGYWGRKNIVTRSDYHKISVNARHPTEYFQRIAHPHDRINGFNIKAKPWHSGDAIMVAGMSAKAAGVAKFDPEEFEILAIEKLRSVTDRPIIYRPKPSWDGARALPGAIFSPKDEPIESVLSRCHAVVTHHSNVAVDALVHGVQVVVDEGVALPMSSTVDNIESRHWRPGRDQLIADIAYCNWDVEEMASGAVWAHLRTEGLVP